MSDMIGLLRFGMPVSVAPVAPAVEIQAQKTAPEIAAVAASSSGGQAAAHYRSTPRPAISPQFAYASAGESAGDSGLSSVVALPEPFDPNVLTGPPPTFEATLLELEAHLRMSLARIDATRNAQSMVKPQPADRDKPEAAEVRTGDAATGVQTGAASAKGEAEQQQSLPKAAQVDAAKVAAPDRAAGQAKAAPDPQPKAQDPAPAAA